jgi:SPP1 gp7 family putative phage head morphogenesis protein
MLDAIKAGLKKIKDATKKIINKITKKEKEQLKQQEKPVIRKYRILAIRDSRTCKVCKGKDGSIVVISSGDSVETIASRMSSQVPPFHVNCRCQLVQI